MGTRLMARSFSARFVRIGMEVWENVHRALQRREDALVHV